MSFPSSWVSPLLLPVRGLCHHADARQLGTDTLDMESADALGLYCLYYVSIIAGGFLADITGRRVLLISTAAFCGASLIIVAIITTVITSPTDATSKASIALIFLWEASFGIQSPLVWITTTEAAPTANREKVLAVATFLGFGVSLLITSVSPYLQNPGYGNLGSKIGFIWGSFSVITVAWVYWTVPEMKGFSLEQLDHLYAQDVPTRQFKRYKFADDVRAVGERMAGEGDAESPSLSVLGDRKSSFGGGQTPGVGMGQEREVELVRQLSGDKGLKA